MSKKCEANVPGLRQLSKKMQKKCPRAQKDIKKMSQGHFSEILETYKPPTGGGAFGAARLWGVLRSLKCLKNVPQTFFAICLALGHV